MRVLCSASSENYIYMTAKKASYFKYSFTSNVMLFKAQYVKLYLYPLHGLP